MGSPHDPYDGREVMDMTLGENLRVLRQNSRMTQQQAADRLGVTRQTVSGYESGRTRPDIDMLQAIAELYGTDLEGVVYGTEPVLKARRIVKGAAWALAGLLAALTCCAAAFLWAANRFFPILNGGVTAQRLSEHKRLSSLWERLDGAAWTVGAVGGLLLTIVLLALRCRFSLRQKLIYLACLAAGLLVPGIAFGLADPVFSPVSYLIVPGRNLLRSILLFLLLQAAEAVVRQREKRHL